MNRERATSLAENLLHNLDASQDDWPLSLITEVYVFGSFARGAQEPGDLDIDVELAWDEEWGMHVVNTLPYGRDPNAVLRKPLSAGRRGYQYTFKFRDRADFDMTLLWRKGDTLDTALGRLHAIQPDPLAGRAPRDSMLPEFEGIEDWVPRPYRTALCAAVSDGALRIERLGLPDGVVASPEAGKHIRLRWNPTSPLRRTGTAVVSHWEQRGIDPGRGHLHGRDIRDQDTPYFANFGWSHFTSIPYCLTEHGGIEWLEVVHPTKTGPLDCLRFVPLDTAEDRATALVTRHAEHTYPGLRAWSTRARRVGSELSTTRLPCPETVGTSLVIGTAGAAAGSAPGRPDAKSGGVIRQPGKRSASSPT